MPCKAVQISNGGLGEITVPCLFVSEKVGGDYVTIKASPALNLLEPTKVCVVLIEGWYLIKQNKDPEFFLVGDTFDVGKKREAVTGPWQ